MGNTGLAASAVFATVLSQSHQIYSAESGRRDPGSEMSACSSASYAARCCLSAAFLLIAGSSRSNRAFFLEGTHSILTVTPKGGPLKDSIMLGGSHSHRNGSAPDRGR